MATSMLRRISVFTNSGSQVSQVDRKRVVKTDSLRVQYSIAAQLSGWNDCDVTRLVATEQVRNQHSTTSI